MVLIQRLAALVLLLQCVGCTETEAIPDGFRVISYDGRSHEYTIRESFSDNGKAFVKNIVAVCERYQVGGLPPELHDTACVLPVGNVYPFTKVLSTNDFVVIAQGPSPDTTQTFKVLHVEVLPEGCR
jgi:hypothetical protein